MAVVQNLYMYPQLQDLYKTKKSVQLHMKDTDNQTIIIFAPNNYCLLNALACMPKTYHKI